VYDTDDAAQEKVCRAFYKLSALLTYIPWTTIHTHSAQHSALANKFQKLINATNEKMLNNYK